MLSYQVFTTTQAESDILGIEDYISDELQSPVSALKISSLIRKKVLSLGFAPERGSVLNMGDEASTTVLRSVRVKKFLVIFYVDKIKRRVYVLRVCYSRRNMRTLLER